MTSEVDNNRGKYDTEKSKNVFWTRISTNIIRLFQSIKWTIDVYKNKIKEFLQEDGVEDEVTLSDGSIVFIRYLMDDDRAIDGKYRALIIRWFDKESTIIEHVSTIESICKNDPKFTDKYVLVINNDRETEEEAIRSNYAE